MATSLHDSLDSPGLYADRPNRAHRARFSIDSSDADPLRPTPLSVGRDSAKWDCALPIRRMAPKKDNTEFQYGTMLGSRHNFKCNYCGHTRQGGGVSCLKKHFAGGRLTGYHDVRGCKSVPSEVKRLIVDHLKGVWAEIARKKADREMQKRIISGRQRDEDDDDKPEIYAEHLPDEYQSGSRVGGETQSRRFSNVGDYFTRIPIPVPIPARVQRKRPTDVTLEEVDLNIYSREHGKVVNGDRRPTIGLVYAKIEAAKKKIRETLLRQMKSFREGVKSFAESSVIAGRDRIDGDDEDLMVAWVARATTERGEYKLDEEIDDPEDSFRLNTFLARAIEAEEEEQGEHGD
ncbi:hypothetical protein Taro_014927, partial [Colocasia esculenta]|nr:hypothetical protein [Colocasia esculenta]